MAIQEGIHENLDVLSYFTFEMKLHSHTILGNFPSTGIWNNCHSLNVRPSHHNVTFQLEVQRFQIRVLHSIKLFEHMIISL